MSFKDRIKNIFRSRNLSEEVINEMEAMTVWPWDDSSRTTFPMKIATVYRCVRLLSDKVASLPLQMLCKTDKGIYVPDDHDRLSFLIGRQPNEMFGAFDFWRQVVIQLLCQGNSYIVPMRNGLTGRYDRLILCTPNSVSLDKLTRTYRVNDATWGLRGEYRPWEIVHIRGISADGFEGMSVLEYARVATQIASAGDKETYERFKNGGNTRGFFTNTSPTITGVGQYNDKVLKKVSEQRELHFRTGGKFSYLPGGMQFKELMMTSADMQFLESRKFTLREICRFFGVHPSFVFDDTSNNYKSAEMANVAFLSDTLNPLLRQMEGELERKLLFTDSGRRIQFDRSGLFACDLESKIKWQAARIAAGIDTPNEARQAENRVRVEGGDTVLMSANLKSLQCLLSEGSEGNVKSQDDE